MIQKNVAGQGVYLYAYDLLSDAPKTGDAANITASVSKDGAAGAATATANPVEIGGGIYWQPLSLAETNASMLAIYWASTTTGVQIDPLIVSTDGGKVRADVVAVSGDSDAADNLEAMLDGTGAQLTLSKLRVNANDAAGAVDIDNAVGPAVRLDAAGGALGVVEIVSGSPASVNGIYAAASGQGDGIWAQSGSDGGAGISGHGVGVASNGLEGIAGAGGNGLHVGSIDALEEVADLIGEPAGDSLAEDLAGIAEDTGRIGTVTVTLQSAPFQADGSLLIYAGAAYAAPPAWTVKGVDLTGVTVQVLLQAAGSWPGSSRAADVVVGVAAEQSGDDWVLAPQLTAAATAQLIGASEATRNYRFQVVAQMAGGPLPLVDGWATVRKLLSS